MELGSQKSNIIKYFWKDRVRIINNGDTEIFKYENVKQYGVLSIVLYNDEKIPRYVITFNDNCKVDPQTYTLKEMVQFLWLKLKWENKSWRVCLYNI